MGMIKIQGIKIYAYHGDIEEEQKLGGHFLVDVHLNFKSSGVENSDLLSDTVDYVEVIKIVETQMQTPAKMLERVGKRIVDKLLLLEKMQKVVVEITKCSPPVDAIFNKISVVIEGSK